MTMQADRIIDEFLALTSDRYVEEKFTNHLIQKGNDHFVLKTFGTKGICEVERIEGASKDGSKCEGNEEESEWIEEDGTMFIGMVVGKHMQRMQELREGMKKRERNPEREAVANEVVRKLMTAKQEETMIIKLSDPELMDEMNREIDHALSEYYAYALKDVEEDGSFYKSMMTNAIASSEGGYAFLRVDNKLESERSDRVLFVSMIKVHLLTVVVCAPEAKQTLLEVATSSRAPMNNSMALSVADMIMDEQEIGIEDAFVLKQYLYDTKSLTKISYYQADAIMMDSTFYKRLLRITLARVALLSAMAYDCGGYRTMATADKTKEGYGSIMHDHNVSYLDEVNRKVSKNATMISTPHALLTENANRIGFQITGCNSGSEDYESGIKRGFGRTIELTYRRILKPLTV